MPWQVTKKGKEFCVEKVMGEGKTENVTCHPSRDKALAHMRALYANEPGARKAPKTAKAWEEAMGAVVEAARS
jgi:hypothetical protein